MAGAGSRHFAYRFVDGRGSEAVGTVEAFSRAEALGKIRARGHFALDVREAAALAAAGGQRRLPGSTLELFAGQVARLLAASVPLDRALDMVAVSGVARIGPVAAAIRTRLRAGAAPAEAFAASPEAFDGAALALIRAGESSGDLAGAFAEIEKLLSKTNAVRARLRSALIYPSVVLVTALGAVLMILLHVIPQFESMVSDSLPSMPLSARLVFGLSGFVQATGPLLLGAAALLGVLVVRAARTGRLEGMALSVLQRVPLAAPVLRMVAPARLARLLGTLLARNVALMDAFDIASAAVPTAELRDAMSRARGGLQQGLTLRAALSGSAAFPPLVLQMLQVGEDTGRVGPMLLHAADLLDEQIDRSMQRFLILFQPMILVVLGLIVGGLLYGLFSAILSINNSIT